MSNEDDNEYTLVSRNPILEAEASKLGISYNDLLKRMEPTEKQKKGQKEAIRILEDKKLKRLNKFRTAFFDSSNDVLLELDSLDTCLVTIFLSIEPPSAEQIKTLFFLLPQHIIGSGISWGFDNPDVVNDIYEFIEEDKELIIEKLGLLIGSDESL